VTIQLVLQALNLYDLPRNVTVALICLSENETWKVEVPSGAKWALRLQRPGYQSKNSLASEIAWLLALRKDGVAATPVPVAGLDGEWIQRVGQRNLVLFEWENGRQPEIEMDLRQCFRALGAVTAQLHTHSRTWQRPGGFERFTWDFEAVGGVAPRPASTCLARLPRWFGNVWRISAVRPIASVWPTAICAYRICSCINRP
jgi:Ser/Thr protein kinase RdoA (MazF antagonist)